MPIREWLDVDGVWTNTANWTGGAVPTTGDTARILKGQQTIAGFTYAPGGAITKLEIGDQFFGSFGSPGTPAAFTNGITTVEIGAPNANVIAINPGACTTFKVRQTGAGPYACYITAGTITSINVASALGLRIGGATVTNLRLAPAAGDAGLINAYLEYALALTNAYMTSGMVTAECDVDTLLQIMNGNWLYKYATAGTMGEIRQFGGVFDWRNKDGTINKYKGYGGLLAGHVDTYAKTFNASNDAESWPGNVIRLDNPASNITVSNNINGYGGKIVGTSSVTIALPDMAP